jgi:hypothetical protein
MASSYLTTGLDCDGQLLQHRCQLKWYRTQLNLTDIILKQVKTFQENPRTLKACHYVTRQEISYLYAVRGTAKFRVGRCGKAFTNVKPETETSKFWRGHTEFVWTRY